MELFMQSFIILGILCKPRQSEIFNLSSRHTYTYVQVCVQPTYSIKDTFTYINEDKDIEQSLYRKSRDRILWKHVFVLLSMIYVFLFGVFEYYGSIRRRFEHKHVLRMPITYT